MKDIKSYVIGFLSCACLFLIMGQTKANVMNDIRTMLTQNGRYQAFGGGTLNTEYMIDTRTGELYSLETLGKNKSKWVRKSAETDWIK